MFWKVLLCTIFRVTQILATLELSTVRKFIAAELMQNRLPVGKGPSSKMWPRWAPHFAHETSVRIRGAVRKVAVSNGNAAKQRKKFYPVEATGCTFLVVRCKVQLWPVDGIKEGRPTTPCVVLGVRGEEILKTDYAWVDARLEELVVLACMRSKDKGTWVSGEQPSLNLHSLGILFRESLLSYIELHGRQATLERFCKSNPSVRDKSYIHWINNPLPRSTSNLGIATVHWWKDSSGKGWSCCCREQLCMTVSATYMPSHYHHHARRVRASKGHTEDSW